MTIKVVLSSKYQSIVDQIVKMLCDRYYHGDNTIGKQRLPLGTNYSINLLVTQIGVSSMQLFRLVRVARLVCTFFPEGRKQRCCRRQAVGKRLSTGQSHLIFRVSHSKEKCRYGIQPFLHFWKRLIILIRFQIVSFGFTQKMKLLIAK